MSQINLQNREGTEQKGNNRPPACRKQHSTHLVGMDNDGIGELAESYQLYHLQNSQSKPLEITLLVNQKELTMEIDTRAAL